MKKVMVFSLVLLLLASCSTYYGKYDYNQYFQNNEPFITVDSEEEAASFISRKLAQGFRRHNRQTISVLPFTDEYGDRINRGDFFAGMIVSGLNYYNNPVVVERESLYELVKERELTLTNLIDNEGRELNKLLQADYILHGRILRGRQEDMISVRCFRVGTGEVIYAATVSIDYRPDPIPVPPAPIPPQGPIIIVDPGTPPTSPTPPPTGPVTKPNPTTDDDKIENGGKIDLNGTKKTPPTDQYQNKKTTKTTTSNKKTTTVTNQKPVSVKSTTTTTVKEKVPVNKAINVKVKEPEEEKEEEVKTTTSKTTTVKKSSTIKK